jgi:hypothetical protein
MTDYTMIIISGAQTGADIAGLKTAKKYGFKTGGYIPKGFVTLDGRKPEYAAKYNIVETESGKYPPRTELNAMKSDGTLWFGQRKTSYGKLCTFKFIKKYRKPYMDLDIDKLPDVSVILRWICENNIKVLNIAGNSEKTTPGIERVVSDYLSGLFKGINATNNL